MGATGYAGAAELVRILLENGKKAQRQVLRSRSYIDENYADIYRNFFETYQIHTSGWCVE